MPSASDIAPFITAGSVLVAAVAYIQGQRWKKSEFTAAQIKIFEDNALVRRAMFMLDFTTGTFVGSDCVAAQKDVTFDTEILARALAAGHLRVPISPEETHIRLAFCEFFEGIERFEHFAESELIDHAELAPYLPYWIKLFTTPREKSPEFRNSIWTFIDTYGYEGVRSAAERLQGKGANGPPSKDDAIKATTAWLGTHGLARATS